MRETEPIEQAEYILAQRQAMQALADRIRHFLPLVNRAHR
jgi:hypothetical protein